METHVARWGNSLALRIPRAVADRLVMRARDAKPTLEELLAGITPDNLPESFDVRPVGKEAL